MKSPTLLALALGLCACNPNHVSGEVDGDPVRGARDAFYDTLDYNFGIASVSYLVVVVTNIPEGCDTLSDLFSTVENNCDDLCDEYVDIADDRKLVRDDYWAVWMTANTADGEEGTFDYDDGLGDEEFTGLYSQWDAAPLHDADDCVDECKDGDLLNGSSESGEDGELEITRSDGDVAVGRFNMEFEGSDALSGSFRAHECDMKEWVWFLGR